MQVFPANFLALLLPCIVAASPIASWAATAPVPPPPNQAPFLPANDAVLLQEVPSSKDPAVQRMQDQRSKADAMPQELGPAIALADAYIDYSRQIGDAHYAGYAEAVIAPWTSLAKPPASALLSQAIILQYRHQFTEARKLLQRTLALEPRNPQALLTLATLDMVQGDYPAAMTNCSQLTITALDLSLACVGNLRAYTGQASQSLVLLQQVNKSASRASADYQAWIDGLIAESAERLGDWPLVEDYYRAALKLLPRDNFLLVAYADFLLDRDRAAEVLPLLADHEQSDTAFLRIALAKSRLGARDTALYTWAMAARFEALRLRGSEYFGREEARFALLLQKDPATSLSMALRNWQVQKAPWDARVVLEAAIASHQPKAADEVIKFLDATHLQDPVILPLVAQIRELRERPAAAPP